VQHPIGDHALLADGRTAALVDPDGNVAWLCWPRIDSTPCLLSLLDDVLGGMFVVAPVDPAAVVVERDYADGTLVLRTVWRIGAAELTILDGLAWDGAPRLVRSLRARGSVDVVARVALAPDAAREVSHPRVDGEVLRIAATGLDVVLRAPGTWVIDGRGVAESRFTVDSVECAVVFCDAGATDVEPSLDGTRARFAATVPGAARVTPNQMASSTLGESTARRLVRQSAAVLTGLHQRGGGIVAAPTTSIPQWPGSGRTWDYRYSWLRDTALAGLGMLRAGLTDDAAGLGDFLGAATATLPRPVLLRVDGTAPPPERTLDHLRGHRGARPVRIGNAASDQPQLDVAGEVLEFAAALAGRDALPRSLREGVVLVADWTAGNWTQPDHGIWEIRGAPRRYTHSRVMAWAGLTQAVGLARRSAVHGSEERWRAAADAIRADVLRGSGALTLHDDGGGPDAALAQASLFGMLAPGDPRMVATLDDIVAALDRDGLIDRYEGQPDQLGDRCGPFLFPTFWVAQALQMCGRDGSRNFAAAAAARGPLGLFAEVADPDDHSPLGNYPQVQSHSAFVLAALDPAT
jgi:GH15 family glucan-1,4-alpha-glucosidase